jgi:hypothetical protein
MSMIPRTGVGGEAASPTRGECTFGLIAMDIAQHHEPRPGDPAVDTMDIPASGRAGIDASHRYTLS